jgi:hypothetical protein
MIGGERRSRLAGLVFIWTENDDFIRAPNGLPDRAGVWFWKRRKTWLN